MRSVAASAPRRKEDPRLLTGQGRFVADLQPAGTLHGVFVRSPHPHARIGRIDPSPALRAGAILALTAPDLPFLEESLIVRYWHPSIRGGMPLPLARDRVRYVGDPVAFLVATDRYAAEDLAALVAVDYEPLPALTSPHQAMRPGAVRLHEAWDGNVAARFEQRAGDPESALAAAERRMRRRFEFPRQLPMPLETRGCLAQYDATASSLDVWLATQVPHNVRANLAKMLRLPEDNVRVIAPDVGGGFGSKSRTYFEELVVGYASLRLRRPVKWIADRPEDIVATTHSRDIAVEVDAGYARDGRLIAVQATLVADIGAYVHASGVITPEVAGAQLPGPYKLPHYRAEVICVGTNKTPLGTYRGAGQPEAAFPLERLLDLVAKDLNLSPVELRLRNLVGPGELPYSPGTTLGEAPVVFESGDFPAVLRKTVSLGGYSSDPVRSEDPTVAIGFGVACGIEVTGYVNYESALVRVDVDGNVTVSCGVCSQGQGQQTTFAQVCADVLGVHLDRITVRLGDTALLAFGKGTFASRGAVMGGNAVAQAAGKVRSLALEAAGRLLKMPPDCLTISAGTIHPVGDTSVALPIGVVARAIAPGGSLFRGEQALEASHVYRSDGPAGTYACSAHVVKVAVNRQTGDVRLLDYVVVHDSGRMLNPTIVEGQIHGGVIEGIGGALLAEALYDDAGQLLSRSWMDYLLPIAADLPPIRQDHLETIPTTNPYGVRGIGEGGTIPAAPAIANAISRALGGHLHGGEDLLCRLPLTPERVLRACRLAAHESPA